MNNLLLRGITGIIFVGLLLGSLWWNALAAQIVFGGFLLLGLIEFFRLFDENKHIDPAVAPGIMAGMAIYALSVVDVNTNANLPVPQLAIVVVFLLMLTELWRKQKQPLINSGIQLLGMVYLVIPFLVLSSLSEVKMEKLPVIAGMLIIIWTNDTFAYLTGRFLGKTKLFERISPKKTWEGTIGGIVFALLAGFIIGWFTDAVVFWMVTALIVAPCAIFGDLLESTYKRSLNIKDSGSILPGHGGILDRFDATLYAAPFFLRGIRFICSIFEEKFNMTLHREGYSIMAVGLLILTGIQVGNFFLFRVTGWLWLFLLLTLGALVMAYLIIQFFRIPKRTCVYSENDVMCPADGKIVVIEEVTESEYFNDKRIQISIFMSPMNVHANYHPISGVTKYVKYHPGLFLVAWHPKSSTDNERSTVVTGHSSGQEVLFRQIAGAVARRICYYVEENQPVKTGEEFGFIKFGSRIDVFLPLGTKINVKIGDKVQGKLTKLGELV